LEIEFDEQFIEENINLESVQTQNNQETISNFSKDENEFLSAFDNLNGKKDLIELSQVELPYFGNEIKHITVAMKKNSNVKAVDSPSALETTTNGNLVIKDFEPVSFDAIIRKVKAF